MNLDKKVCLVVIGQTIHQFLTNLKAAQQKADLIELRVDFIKNISLNHLDLIKAQTKKTAIFTCRPQSVGGHFNKKEAFRLSLIKQADKLGFDFIDLELETLLTKSVNLTQSQLIISHHNFTTTLSFSKLKNILTQMDNFKPTIKKIATLVKSQQDVQTLMKLLIDKKPSENLIIIGMGQKGKTTRLVFPMIGSYLTYVSLNNSSSAPGQIDIKKIKLTYQQFNNL